MFNEIIVVIYEAIRYHNGCESKQGGRLNDISTTRS